MTENDMDEKVLLLKEKIDQADAVIIGAGAGLSTAAGFVYSGERFDRYFSDFSQKYGFRDPRGGGRSAPSARPGRKGRSIRAWASSSAW